MNKLILITGGSSGIGFALGKAYAKKGWDVAMLARDEVKLAQAQSSLSEVRISVQQRVLTLSVDISDSQNVAKQLGDWINIHGQPDMLINCAGYVMPGYVQALSPDVFRYTMETNFLGMVNVTHACLPGMIARGSGHIINISSLAGILGVFGYSAYGASKFAIRGYSDVLRAEMKPLGINVSIAFPPDTDTPQLAFEAQYKPFETKEIAGSAKVLHPDHVANAIIKGIQRNQYIIIPGFDGKLFYFLSNFLGKAIYPIMDMMVKAAIKKKNKS